MSETNPKLFKDVAFVMYPVKDVKIARAFYEGQLGLTVTANWQDQWIEYDIGHGTLAIVVADEKHTPGAHGPSVGLEVTDFELVMNRIQQQNIPIAVAPFETPVCRGCIIRDPDGNELMVHARK